MDAAVQYFQDMGQFWLVDSDYSKFSTPEWQEEARRAFEWFLGRNDLGLALYDSNTGGCGDGLHSDRVNENQGAESSLAFHLSLAEMNFAEHPLPSRQ